MSLYIIKRGVLDTVQDSGRYGYQHLGINPTGAMDRFSAGLANALLGKEQHSPVMELHFPAAHIRFQKEAILCITGADFTPLINEQEVPLYQPVAVGEQTVLHFNKRKAGAITYIAFYKDLLLPEWLGSYSTHLKVAAGGYQGRALQAGDVLPFAAIEQLRFLQEKEVYPLPWKAAALDTATNEIEVLPGNEWNWLSEEAQIYFQNQSFYITPASDRMGYHLTGNALAVKEQKNLLSSATPFGTIQLLPNGQLIILMADHQTTGGYPRVAHVISAHLHRLAQMAANQEIRFRLTHLESAEQKLMQQHRYLEQIQNDCTLKMEKWLHAAHRH